MAAVDPALEKKISIRNILNRTKSKNVEDMEKFKEQATRVEPPKDLSSDLNDAIMEGSLSSVQSLVGEGANYSGPIDDKRQTVLHVAAFSQSVPIVEYFLSQKKPDVNAVDEHQWTALLCAASVGNVRICSLLLQNGADAKINSDQKTTPLHYLCRKAVEDEQYQEKRKSGAMTNGESNAVKYKSYLEVLELLTSKGVDINAQNYLGETALMQACSRGNEPAVQFLLGKKAKTALQNGKGEHAFFYAEKVGNQNIIKLLLQEKKDGNKKTLITHQNIKLDALGDVVNVM